MHNMNLVNHGYTLAYKKVNRYYTLVGQKGIDIVVD